MGVRTTIGIAGLGLRLAGRDLQPLTNTERMLEAMITIASNYSNCR